MPWPPLAAALLSPAQEAERVLHVIRALMQEESTARMPLSVDTFYAEVAAAAVEAGATMVNDVSGGTLDPHMYRQVGAVDTRVLELCACPSALPVHCVTDLFI